MNRPLFAIGDETGLPLILQACGKQNVSGCLVDPERQRAVRWARAHFRSDEIWFHPPKKKRKAFLKRFKRHRIVLGVMCSYSRWLWPDLIAAFPRGVVNLHGGMLPEYRGANVLQWAILNGEKTTAMTLHYVDGGVDTGPVIDEKKVVILTNDTAREVREKLILAGRILLRRWSSRLVVGKVAASRQKRWKDRTWSRRAEEDSEIDWKWPAVKIRNLTRAMVPPWGRAFYRDGQDRKILIRRVLTLDEARELKKRFGR